MGSTLKIKFLMCAMFENNKISGVPGLEDSTITIWRNSCWSLRALYEGRFPENDWKHQQWDQYSSEASVAGYHLCSEEKEFLGVVWSIKGDLDWFFKGLGLKSYNDTGPCEYCHCDTHLHKSMWPTDFGVNADWKNQMWTASEWRNSKTQLHVIFKEFAFLSQHNLEADELHILHLGVSQYFLGSVLWLLVYVCLNDSPNANFAKVWSMILEEYQKYPGSTEYTKLSLSSFHDPNKHDQKCPKLKGRGCEVKSLLLPLQSIWEKV